MHDCRKVTPSGRRSMATRCIFRGTCYRAANWIWMGRTHGRGKDDLTHLPNRILKEVLGLPLIPDFRDRLLAV
jgi:hypothetical protein